MWSDLTLDPSFKVKQGYPNLKVLISCLLFVLEVCNVKPTYRKSWAGKSWLSDELGLVTFVSFIEQTYCLLSVSTSCSHKHLGPLPTGVYLCQP